MNILIAILFVIILISLSLSAYLGDVITKNCEEIEKLEAENRELNKIVEGLKGEEGKQI